MKTYKGLYDICISESNRRTSIQGAKKSRRIRNMIRERHLSDDELLILSREWIANFRNANHSPICIWDGIGRKKRTIIVPTLEELVVQYCIVNALKDMFFKGMYEHSYASIPGRGSHLAKKHIEKWIRRDLKNTKYVLKMDIHHFFDSISNAKLKQKLSRSIKDDMMLNLLFEIIDVIETGIPLGFYTSQWLSNWYLKELDHYIKEQLCAVYYVRYMDDMVIFGANKKHLHKIRKEIERYLKEKLDLCLKSNWQVFPLDRNGKGRELDFMGFRFYRNRTTIHRSIMYKMTRKAVKISKKGRVSAYDARQMLSYLGWIDCTDTYWMYKKRI